MTERVDLPEGYFWRVREWRLFAAQYLKVEICEPKEFLGFHWTRVVNHAIVCPEHALPEKITWEEAVLRGKKHLRYWLTKRDEDLSKYTE